MLGQAGSRLSRLEMILSNFYKTRGLPKELQLTAN
jgi:hypothetical protein